MPPYHLPKDKKDLAQALRLIIRQGVDQRNIHQVEWLFNHYYMRGCRRFTDLDFASGTLRAHYENTTGDLQYRYEQALRRYTDELGRRMKVDVHPVVDREGRLSLDGLRKDSMAKVVLDNMVAGLDLESIKYELLQLVMTYGTAGLACFAHESVRLSRTEAVMEVIPPWQLLPIPANPNHFSEVTGLIRYRLVPVDWLKTKKGLAIPEDLETVDVTYGDAPEKISENFNAGGGPEIANWNRDEAADPAKQVVKHTYLAETFCQGYDGSLVRYVVWAGGKVLQDRDFEKVAEPPMMPVAVVRDIPTGGFYGRSFASMVIPTNYEVEYLMKSLFENAQDLDAFGYLMLPANMGIDVEQFKQTSKPRFVMYEPDLSVPNHMPFNIAPANTGDFPGKVAMLGKQIIDDMSGQSAMMRGDAPGRVDSAQGLGFLYETSSIPLLGPMQDLARSFTTIYKAMLGVARQLWDKGTLAKLTMLDDMILGVVIDPASGQVSLAGNDVPHPNEVKLKVRSEMPRSVQQRKQELLQMLQLQIVSPREFRRISMTEGLDFPVGNRAEWENWRKATLSNVILFGDGQTPGQVVASEMSDMPDVQLESISTFMARPEFTLASPQVRQAFEQRKQYYQSILGQIPPQMGNMEDEAMGQAQMQQMQQAMPPGGGF